MYVDIRPLLGEQLLPKLTGETFPWEGSTCPSVSGLFDRSARTSDVVEDELDRGAVLENRAVTGWVFEHGAHYRGEQL
jgi:hypothetical protein